MRSSIDVDRIAAELSPEGALAQRLPAYEPRPEQVRMARAVARTLEFGGILVVEAGTGTGKSLAYLVPAIHWVRENRERVIVSTRTINLQEQLVRTDLPFLERNLGIDFTAALVKGRSNYVCLRKAREIREQPCLLPEESARVELDTILRWSEETDDGSLSDLGFVPRFDSWEAVMAEHDDCLRARCPEYESCFFYRARRAAATADLLVVNHSLLMADQALRAGLPETESSGILPGASRLVVDEAHHLEDVSTDSIGGHVTLRRIERLLAALQGLRQPERGILPALLERLGSLSSPEDRPAADRAAEWVEERLRPRIPALEREAAGCFDALLALVQAEIGNRPRSGAEEESLRVVPALRGTVLWSETNLLLSGLVAQLAAFREETEPVLERLDAIMARRSGSPWAPSGDDAPPVPSETSPERLMLLAARLRAHADRLAGVAADLATFLADDGGTCRWYGVRPGRDRMPVLSLRFAPVEIGPVLRDTLFERFESVVLTSATLTVEKRFDYFLERSGLSAASPDRVERLRLASPFRYEDQVLLAVPEDLPEPDQPGYEEATHEAIVRTVTASRGGAFVLFTSYGALIRAHAVLAERLHAAGVEVLRQGDLDRHALLERFRRHPAAALFATDSFWEGVDVRGEGLRAVLIARLPFRVPTEPIQQARMEAIEARGGNPFGEYGLPQAVIRLRQGFGRLIRSREDTGVVVLLDSRIARRRYGEVFLESLPPARLVVGPAEIVLGEVERFFGR